VEAGLFFDVDNFTALVMAAVGTHGMRQPHFTAIAALDQVTSFQRVMGATAITAARSVFPFWLWGHGLTPELKFIKHPDGTEPGTGCFQRCIQRNLERDLLLKIKRMPAHWAGSRRIIRV
jgi:hypothetical protein